MDQNTVTDTEVIKPDLQNVQQKKEEEQRPFTTLEIGAGFFENFDFYKPSKIQEINNNSMIPQRFKQEHIDKIDNQIEQEVQKGKKQYQHIYNHDSQKEVQTEDQILQNQNLDFEEQVKEIYIGNPNNPQNKNIRKNSIFMVSYNETPIEIVGFLPNKEYQGDKPLIEAEYDSNGNKIAYKIVHEGDEEIEFPQEEQNNQQQQIQQEQEQNEDQQQQQQQQQQVQQQPQEKQKDIYNDEEYFSENIENYQIITPIFRQIHSRHNKNFKFNYERQKYFEQENREDNYNHYVIKNSFKQNILFSNGAFYKLNLFTDYLKTPKFYIQNEPIIGNWWAYQQSHRDPYRYMTFHSFPYFY